MSSDDIASENEETRLDPTQKPIESRARVGNRKVPIPKKKQPDNYRVLPREKRNGLVIIKTGDGKGKTTAALGLLLRAAGREMSVGMYQFVKSTAVSECGEQIAAARIGITLTQLGAGCMLHGDNVRDNRERAKSGWTICRDHITNGTYDILILDEFTGPVRRGWIGIPEIIETLANRPKGTHVVITGRGAPQELIDAADLVTEMRVIKHPYQDRGLLAQAGIDV